MDTQKTKSIFTFILLTGVFLYVGNMAAREPQYTATRSGRSTQFLNDVAVLDRIQFDLDFINAFGNTTIKTEVYIPPITPSETGRDNPFMKSNPSTFFGGTQNIPNNTDTFFEPNVPYEENPAPYEPPEYDDIPLDELPLDDILREEQQNQSVSEEFPEEQAGYQSPQEPQEQQPQEQQPEPPQESSATLTL